MELKLTINDGAKSYKHVVKEPESNVFIGLKLGEKVLGDAFGLPGYEFTINGGSSITGMPMHKGIIGSDLSKRLVRLKNGSAVRKSVMGNTISEKITQVNLIVAKKGGKELAEYFKKEEAPAN